MRDSDVAFAPGQAGVAGKVRTAAVISPHDAWTIRRLLVGRDPDDGELARVAVPFRGLAMLLAGMGVDARPAALDGFLCGRDDRERLVKALAEADPDGPRPEAEESVPFATLADIRRSRVDVQYLWDLYIPRGALVGLAAYEGVGKTREAMDLARRIWFALPWPDGQAPTLPARTPTLWVCSDGQQDEILAIAEAFGMPDEAVYFNTTRDEPYGGTEVDDVEDLERLEAAIGLIEPGLVFIDSMTNATSADVCRATENKQVMAPLRDIAKRTRTTVVSLLHLSREGQPLGRRIKGITRVILNLECPDPDHPARLKMWVSKSFDKKPPALGVTMGDGGNECDLNPPSAPEASKGGRPPAARGKAEEFIRADLAKANDRIGNELCAEFEKAGGSESTFWRTIKAMRDEGKLATSGGKGTGQQTILHLIQPDPEADDARPF